MIRLPTLLLALALLMPLQVGAHQDGCHAYHACPSDTGSYVCGDMGHCSTCGDNAYCSDGESHFGRIRGVVTRVIDGDTIRVTHDFATLPIRLWGVDAPERNQPRGKEATAYAKRLALGQRVEILVRDRDRYGRYIGEVWLPGGVNLSRTLAEAGLAMWYEQYSPDDRMLHALQSQAQEDERGLWGDPEPIPPWEWRRGER